MINSIPQIEYDKYAFENVAAAKSPNAYWLMPDNVDSAEFESKQDTKFDAGKILITPDEARKTNNLSIIGLSIAGATVFTAAGLFFILKGGPKNLPKYFQKVKTALEKIVSKSKLTNDGNISFKSKAYIYMIKSLDFFQKKFEAVNNFTSFKDLTFKKIMYSTKLGTKIHDGITRMFERIGRQTVVNTYRKTTSKINSLDNLADRTAANPAAFSGVFIDGERIPKERAIKRLKEMNKDLADSYNKNFGQKALESRYRKFKKAVDGLKSKLKSPKDFWSKDVYSEFMADASIMEEKTGIHNTVRNGRKNISYSYLDMASELEDKIINLTKTLSSKDADKIKDLRGIMLNIKKYAKNPSANYELKEKIIQNLDNLTNNIKSKAAVNTSDTATAESLLNGISDIRKGFTEFKQGKVEDILDIYRQILPENEFRTVEKVYKSAIKSLDNSVKTETEDFISKLRDLSLGSAPTDILTLLGSLGVLGYQLGKSDDNDQRMSISLKYGIPALAGIGTVLYCNAKLYAGTKSLIFGTISTLIVNKLGVYIDAMRKKYVSKKPDKT